MTRRAECIPTLAGQNVIQVGTVLEVMPQALPPGADNTDPRFRARIVDLRGRQDSVEWEFDRQRYSLTELTNLLAARLGVTWPWGYYTFRDWRRVGHTASLWDEAEQFPR
jgi:hypothetical protein